MNKQAAKKMVCRLMKDCRLDPTYTTTRVFAAVDGNGRGIEVEFITTPDDYRTVFGPPDPVLRIVLRAEVFHPNRFFGGRTKARTFIAGKVTGLFNEVRMRKAIAAMAKEVRQSREMRAMSITTDKNRMARRRTTARGLQKHGINPIGDSLTAKVPTRFGNLTVTVVAPTSMTVSLPALRTISEVAELLERLR